MKAIEAWSLQTEWGATKIQCVLVGRARLQPSQEIKERGEEVRVTLKVSSGGRANARELPQSLGEYSQAELSVAVRTGGQQHLLILRSESIFNAQSTQHEHENQPENDAGFFGSLRPPFSGSGVQS